MRVGGWLPRLRHLPSLPRWSTTTVSMPASRQRSLQVRADEAGPASYQDHVGAIYVESSRRPGA